MKKIVVLLVVLLVIVGGAFVVLRLTSNNEDQNQFAFAEIVRGDLENTVTSTGTIEAVGTVEVGTQVSGTIAYLYADFNDQVTEGQLLAVLDTTVLNASVREAEASVEQSKAQVEEALANYERNLPLYNKGFLSEAEFLPIRTAVQTQQALVKSAQAKLERAKQNYEYAFIRSPITGTIIQRNVEAGQTVAASLSAPVLFVIAENLSQMEIKALVDESDIGQINAGQEIRFTVLAYPDETFEGSVRQVRLQPATVQNVVNYTVVIDADNEDNHLLPGMTATVDFIIKQGENIMMIKSTALQFQPSIEMIESSQGLKGREAPKRPEFTRSRIEGREPPPSGSEIEASSTKTMEAQDNSSRLWYFKEDGSLAFFRVTTGISASNNTEIIADSDVKEGMSFISGYTNVKSEKKEISNTSSGPPGRGLGRI